MALEEFRTQHIDQYRSPSKKLKKPAKKTTTKAKSPRKKKEKPVGILPIPGFAYYQLNGECVISTLSAKPSTLEARNGTFVLLSNREQCCRLTLEEIKQICNAEV